MALNNGLSRRSFFGSMAAALTYVGVAPSVPVWAQMPVPRGPRARVTEQEYDGFAKLANNENNWGPPESVMQAMNHAFKYANRYGYPDPGLAEAVAEVNGIKTENLLFSAGSGEILDLMGSTYLRGGKKVLGAEPTYGSVYQYATGIKADAIRIPLRADYNMDIPAMIKAAKQHYREIGFVYIVSPNNPTARIVPKQDMKLLMDNLPDDMPVLIDEAYHHFVDNPDYETSMPLVNAGRRVVVARTFSKIAALAAMRLGYAAAPKDVLEEMRPNMTGTLNVLVRYGGTAAIKDTAGQEKIKRMVINLRNKTTAELDSMGHKCIPSDANFFMVHLGRRVEPVIEEFRKRGVLVGRPFPPMVEHLRVSVGTPDEMTRFVGAFKEIFAGAKPTAAGANG